MHKITRKIINEFKRNTKELENSTNKIINIIKNKVAEEYKNSGPNWNIEGIKFLNDSYYNKRIIIWEWVEISETEYYKIRKDHEPTFPNCKTPKYSPNIKEEYIYEPKFEIIYYKKSEVKYEYIRVYVHESWGYGGNDDLCYDFLLSDILNNKDLRKEKLKKLMLNEK